MPYLPIAPYMELAIRPGNPASDAPPAVNADAVSPGTDNLEATASDAHANTPDGDAIMEDYGTVSKQQEERAKYLKAKNRRKRYLELHPEYFEDSSLELADPLLYDRMIRRFQTAAEREAEGRKKGFSGQMSTDLWRAEAKKEALLRDNPHSLVAYSRGPNGEIMEEDKDDVPMSKEEGKAWWLDEMTQRFLRGDDYDFDYQVVDGNDKYNDPEEERDLQEAYFDSMSSDFDSDGEGKEKILTGQTGIQDY